MLDGAKGRWAKELPYVLWGYRTTSRRSTGETPFSLTYGAEVVISAEVNLCSARVGGFVPFQNDRLLVECLDLLEKYREAVTIRLVEYQQKFARQHNWGIKTGEFSAGELVLRKVVGNMRNTNAGKLALAWEGLYRVIAIAGARAYYLEDLNERSLPRP